MSKYTTSSILFAIVLFVLVIDVQYNGTTFWILLIPVLLFLVLIVIGSSRIKLNFFFKSLNHIKTSDKIIALTFDDGPNPTITPQLLQLLDKYNVKATFFLIGKNIKDNKDVLAQMMKNGHLLGNHSFSHHLFFDLFSSEKMAAEIKATNVEIEKACGKTPKLFRPPYGVTNPALKKAIEKTEMISAGWSLRSFDTMNSKEKVLKKLKRKTKAGDVVLFHDTDGKILAIMEEYLSWLEAHQFKVVSLESLFKISAYEVD